MPRDRGADKLRPDTNEIAFRTVQAALRQAEKPELPEKGPKHPAAVRRGRKGGRKGGPARAKALGVAKRRQSMRKAARGR